MHSGAEKSTHWRVGKAGRCAPAQESLRGIRDRAAAGLILASARGQEVDWQKVDEAIADEVNPVIRTLRAKGIEVTALHSHMLDEEPRLYFMHFWADDDTVKLAKGLRAALDKMANAKS